MCANTTCRPKPITRASMVMAPISTAARPIPRPVPVPVLAPGGRPPGIPPLTRGLPVPAYPPAPRSRGATRSSVSPRRWAGISTAGAW